MFENFRHVLYEGASAAPRLDRMAPILLDICNGMLYLHSRGVVHGGKAAAAAAAAVGYSRWRAGRQGRSQQDPELRDR